MTLNPLAGAALGDIEAILGLLPDPAFPVAGVAAAAVLGAAAVGDGAATPGQTSRDTAVGPVLGGEYRRAVVEALRITGLEISADAAAIQDERPQGLLWCTVRLGSANEVLPTREDAVAQAGSGGIVRASTMLMTSLQQAGNAFRVTVKLVDVQTSAILLARSGTSEGADASAARRAAVSGLADFGPLWAQK